jgi:hypothetical protein
MTARNVAAMLVQFLFVLSARELSAQQSDERSRACRGGRWLPPHELRTADGYTLLIERPSVVRVHGETFVIAFPVKAYDSIGKLVWPLAAKRETGPQRVEETAIGALEDANGVSRLVPSPTELVVARWGLEATVDDRGIAHVVWASNDSTPMTSMSLFRSLWYARFDGRRWSAPVRILTSDGNLMWIPSNRSPLVVRGGSLHLAVAVRGEGVRYVRYADGRWSNRHVDIPAYDMGYPQLAVLRTGRVVLMVQGAVHSELTQFMAGMFVTWSDDGGRSWAPLVHISTPEGEPAYDGQLSIDDADALYAAWYQQTDAQGNPALETSLGGSPGRIHVARSTDAGAAWQHFPGSALIGRGGGLQTMLRPDHSLLAAVVDAPHEQMLTTSWSGGWSPLQPMDAKPDPFNPALGLGGAQRPVLTWSVKRTPRWGGTMVTTFVACR